MIRLRLMLRAISTSITAGGSGTRSTALIETNPTGTMWPRAECRRCTHWGRIEALIARDSDNARLPREEHRGNRGDQRTRREGVHGRDRALSIPVLNPGPPSVSSVLPLFPL